MTPESLEEQLAATQQAMARLEDRIRIVEDIQEIHAVQRRYVNGLLAAEWDACADCFAQDARLAFAPVVGRENIRTFLKEEISKTHQGKEGDILVHPDIVVDGDRAKGKWLLYMMYSYVRTGQAMFWVHGFYENEYVRENGTWKISLMDWNERMGLPGGGPPTGLW